jgi:LCP family protein required for cell wall assembly
MQCSEARLLIDEGVSPGSTNSLRASLGFHLSGCAACRAYRASASEQALLGSLLAEGTAQELTTQPLSTTRPRPPRVSSRARPAPWWRYFVVGVLAVLAMSLGLIVGRIARAAYTISDNFAAMQITTVATRPPGTPTLTVPTPLPVTAAPAVGALNAATATPAAPGLPPSVPMTPDAGLGDTVTTGPPTGAVGPPAAVGVLPTPIRLPAIGGAPVPTLMPTIGVAPMSGEALNILLLGSDRRPGESWQTRSDAIMVVRIEPARQRVALLSFPRDLIVNIPGYGYARINAATVYGDMYPELGGGTQLARTTVSGLLGIPIHHVVRVDFNAFITAVDTIGGIDLIVEKELYDPAYPTMDYGTTIAHFLPGPQHLDGASALMYARLRHADSDYHRARRQQQVVQAIMQRVREGNVLGQVQMMADLSTALRDNIQTDLSLDQMIGIAWAFRNFAPDQTERYALDENLTSVGVAGDPYAITASPWAIQQVVGDLLGTP